MTMNVYTGASHTSFTFSWISMSLWLTAVSGKSQDIFVPSIPFEAGRRFQNLNSLAASREYISYPYEATGYPHELWTSASRSQVARF
ncbi:hypothetical protein F5878DRAFT_121065 [Lentinula raphanica]|uniref:Secreted protein n=1 Tax=Lentinula raphanica TaxID=153919 RepID=A0AA38PAQ5_9AGAR|nr:hypothetical protein C8R42DRAFT_132386 [Lentinula raphanica]KAJ3839435.1 hypothetical protein F5878DRAFT_121065 [Lentinula raphanica]